MKRLRNLFAVNDEDQASVMGKKSQARKTPKSSSTMTRSKANELSSGFSSSTEVPINLITVSRPSPVASQDSFSINTNPSVSTRPSFILSQEELPTQPTPTFDSELFQRSIKTFLEEKFDSLNENRKRDNEHWESQLAQIKKRKINSHVFKYKSNKIQYEFLSEVAESLEEAKDLLAAGSKRRLNSELDDLSAKISKRQKIIRLADRSVAGWDTVNEYLTDELASGSDDDKKMRQAEARAISKKSREAKQKTKSTSSSKSFPKYFPRPVIHPSFVHQPPVVHPPKIVPLVPQPFLGQGAVVPQQSYRAPVPTNVCFECGLPGHWRASCPTKQN